MAVIRPFRAIRPKQGLEKQIAALPYDVYNRKEAKDVVKKNPISFLAIDRAETQFEEDADMYADCIYQKAHDLLWERVQQEEFVTEASSCYYVYELIMDGRSQTGLTACASIDDYLSGTIKKHENTREDKEIDRIKHVSTCEAQTGPIFLAYRSNPVINEITKKTKETAPLYHFTSEDGVTHKVWIISKTEDIKQIECVFQTIGEIYIADGHHRCASAVKVGLQKRNEKPDFTGAEEFNYFLSVLFPDEELMIMDYNRVVKDLNGYDIIQFIEKLETIFTIEKKGNIEYKPQKKNEIGMFLEGEWYCLTVKTQMMKEELLNHPVESLDVSILQREVLAPFLNIKDPKTDQRIDFVGGIRGLQELERRVKTDCKVAFAMYPTDISELFEVADAGLLMPPKSTWFEPKLRSGLFLHSIKE